MPGDRLWPEGIMLVIHSNQCRLVWMCFILISQTRKNHHLVVVIVPWQKPSEESCTVRQCVYNITEFVWLIIYWEHDCVGCSPIQSSHFWPTQVCFSLASSPQWCIVCSSVGRHPVVSCDTSPSSVMCGGTYVRRGSWRNPHWSFLEIAMIVFNNHSGCESHPDTGGGTDGLFVEKIVNNDILN